MNERNQREEFGAAPRLSRNLILSIFYTVIFLIVYGSLYPFHFTLDALTVRVVEEFIASWRQAGGRGDILGNVALFIPFGALGMLTLPVGTSLSRHFTNVSLIGFHIAIGVQVAQLFIPERDAMLGDALWNMLGL